MLFLLLSLADTEEKKDIISRIYEECYPSLLRTALSILNNKHNAEDAVQSTMLRIVKNMDKYDFSDFEKVKILLYISVRNTALNTYNSLRNSKETDLPDVPEAYGSVSADAFELAMNDLLAETIYKAFDALDQKYRDVCILRFYHGLKEREIAELLQIPQKTVSTRIARGREALRNSLKEKVK